MKALRWTGISLLVILMLLFTGFWWLTVPDAKVPRTVIPFSDMRKYRQWMDQYHPARLQSGQSYELTLTEQDLQKLAILLASTQPSLAHSQFRARVDAQRLRLNVWWPTGVFGRYLPLQLHWQPQAPFELQRLSLAGFSVPEAGVQRINQRLTAIPAVQDVQRLWQQLEPRLDLAPGEMTVHVVWRDPQLSGWLRDFAPFWADGRQRERLHAEVVWLQHWLGRQTTFRIPLRHVLSAMMGRPDFHWEQDAAPMLGALTYASLGEVSGLKPGVDLPELPFKRFTLHGRYDLARHFLLAMWLGTQMSPESVLELAVYKEWSDALTRSSGFSAEDMVANVAGLELLALLRQDRARLDKGFDDLTDDTLMPPADFWLDWQQGKRRELTESQIRELVDATRDWLRDSPLYQTTATN